MFNFANCYVSHYQRGKSHQIPLNHHFPMVFLWFSYGLHPPPHKYKTLTSTGLGNAGAGHESQHLRPRHGGPWLNVRSDDSLGRSCGNHGDIHESIQRILPKQWKSDIAARHLNGFFHGFYMFLPLITAIMALLFVQFSWNVHSI